MTQNTEQNVRTREDHIDALASQFGEEGTFSYVDDRDAATQHILEAEARGATEQRRKDAESEYPSAYRWTYGIGGKWRFAEKLPTATSATRKPKFVSPLYTRPANVAALEGRIAELEAENARLKNNPLENDVTCALMDSQYVAGAKFGWNCSQDEDHESLTKMIEGRLRDRIEAGVSFSKRSQDARAALKRAGTPS